MTLEWIAARLFMGAPTHAASLLQHQEAEPKPVEKHCYDPATIGTRVLSP